MMKRKRFVLGLWLLVVGGMVLSSCMKNEGKTIALIGTEYYIDDILTVIPETLQAEFKAAFGDIPEGPIPENIEGSYVMSPKQRVHSNANNWYATVVEPNVYLAFADQNNGIMTMDLTEETEFVTDTVFIMGNGNAFTVYFIEDKTYDFPFNNNTYHVKMKRGVIMKGKVKDEGLADFQYASIILEATDDSQGVLEQYAPGTYFIYKDGDGLAKRIE